jgi:hypothetical protein
LQPIPSKVYIHSLLTASTVAKSTRTVKMQYQVY